MVRSANPHIRPLVQRVRDVVKNAIPEAEEQIKWGSPTYSVNHRVVANIMCYGDHVNLGFFTGAKLKSAWLQGTRKGLRHIKVHAIQGIDEREFSRLLKEAAAMAKRTS